ncbi:MAG: hypothetical protein JWM41_3346 [Gemmatimonadetes bacterium]|nr:hypothetical protein [Gemmatimonadota bacterium]
MDRAVLEDFLVFTALIVGTGCLTGIIITWLKRRGRAELTSSQLMNRLDDISERLARLDGSVDTMAVEVERISEAQRFTARVLAERAAQPALPEKPRSAGSSTPH